MHSPRVVSLAPSSTEIVCALGCGAWLVGRSHACAHPGWVRELPAVTSPPEGAPGTAPHVEVDAERLAALRADVVLGPDEPSTLAGLWREVRGVADALGVPERGVQLATRLERRLRAVGERAASLGPRPRVAFIAGIEPLMGPGVWAAELVALAGGEILPDAPGTEGPGLEWGALCAAEPEVLWVAPPDLDLAHARAATTALAGRPGWSEIGAVRAGRVFVGDGLALFRHPGPRVTESLEALTEALHPAAFRFGHEGRGWARHAAIAPPVPSPGR